MSPLLFDLDGVLVDSRVPIARSINFALVRLGLPTRPDPALYRHIGSPLWEVFRDLLGPAGADPSRVEAAIRYYRERYDHACAEETTLIPGIARAVERLGRGRCLAVATSKPTLYAERILAGLGLARAFRVIVGPDLDPRGEPKCDTVRRALDALRRAGAHATGRCPILVGDRCHDVSAGRANGLVTVGVCWGIGTEQELKQAGADYLVRDPEALVALIESEPDGSARPRPG